MDRRIFETVVIIVILLQPVLGLVRIAAHHAMATSNPGSLKHTIAEDAVLTVQR